MDVVRFNNYFKSEGILDYYRGCLLEALSNGHVDYIAHQCNCFNSFGRGIALTIKNRFPLAYLADQQTVRGDKEKLGTFTKADNIYNVYGQFTYGFKPQETIYEALEEGLRKVFSDILKDHVELNRTPVLGLPLIGCGLAGGDWEVVKEMLNNLIAEFDEAIKVAVYII